MLSPGKKMDGKPPPPPHRSQTDVPGGRLETPTLRAGAQRRPAAALWAAGSVSVRTTERTGSPLSLWTPLATPTPPRGRRDCLGLAHSVSQRAPTLAPGAPRFSKPAAPAPSQQQKVESDCTHFSDRELSTGTQHSLEKARRASGTPSLGPRLPLPTPAPELESRWANSAGVRCGCSGEIWKEMGRDTGTAPHLVLSAEGKPRARGW